MSNTNEKQSFATRAVHAGNGIDTNTGAIKHAITMANSYVLPYDATTLNWSDADVNIYTRNGGANQGYLQEKLASLEGGEDCVVLASGVAALSGLFFALLKSGDHVIFSSVTYIAVYRLLNAVKAAIRPNTKLIHIETPGNPTLNVTDIKAIADLAHEHNILLSCDNTFASPYNQRPCELGADFTVESLTKYINGHGDAMGGAIIGKKEYLDIIRAQSQVNLGATISPMNAWLIMRGSVTLPLRMKKHNENAQAVAEYLESLPCTSFVAYPGLKSSKYYELAKEQMPYGCGGVFSFGLKADHDTINKFISELKMIVSAVSLGHEGSLIVFLGEDDERQYLYPEEFHNGFMRFSVGLEDAEDIIADLDQALRKSGILK